MPELSVIIPAYNQARYLGKAVQSVLDQSFTDFEVVVVDDGSTDETASVANSFVDPRVRYIHQQNRGLSGARNTGITFSSGRYLLFLDSDDWLMPDALQTLLAGFVAEKDAGAIIGGWRHSGDHLPPLHTHDNFPPLVIDTGVLLLGNPFPVHSALVERDGLDRVGIFDEGLRACEDWDLWLRLLLDGQRFKSVKQVVCVYRKHPGQMTRDPERMRKAMLAVLDRAFAAASMPDEMKVLRNQAYARAYINAAAGEYRAGFPEMASRDLAEAVQLAPWLADDAGEPVSQILMGWAFDPSTEDPAGFLEAAYGNLPSSLDCLTRRRRDLVALTRVRIAFLSFRDGNLSAAGKSAWRAICGQPRWVANRGLVSILVRSLVAGLRQTLPVPRPAAPSD